MSVSPSRADRIAWAVIVAGVITYGVVFSLRTIAAYTSVTTLFDLATYQQGFWNALGWPPFYYSTEGEMSRFGRHFSPVFYLMLPAFWIYPEPPTLLVVHSFALGLGAVPVFLLGRHYLGRASGVILGLAYLLSPAVQDINVQNEFHEIAFALPALLLAFYLGLTGRRWWFVASLLLALSTREEIAVTTALFGLYLTLSPPGAWVAALPKLFADPAAWFRTLLNRALSDSAWSGRACVVLSLIWLVAVVFVAMPYLNAGSAFPVPEGYEHLGTSPAGILRGIVAHPGTVVRDVLSAPKLNYVFWLLAPTSFLSLLAPEVLVVAAPALAEILFSRYPPHFYVFERYTSPVLPVVVLAAILGIRRLSSRSVSTRVVPAILSTAILLATLGSQAVLRKYPTEFRFEPDAHAQAALRIATSVPPTASIAVADHRLLAHLASRRSLYVLGPGVPSADYVIFDRGRAPITQYSPAVLRAAEDRFVRDAEYRGLVCDDGVFLLGSRSALQRGSISVWSTTGQSSLAQFGQTITLDGMSVRSTPAGATVDLTWHATGRGYPDYQVFVHLVDSHGSIVAQSDSGPSGGRCPTSGWAEGISVRDVHSAGVPAASPPPATVRVGLYDLLTMERLKRTDSATRERDFFELDWASARAP